MSVRCQHLKNCNDMHKINKSLLGRLQIFKNHTCPQALVSTQKRQQPLPKSEAESVTIRNNTKTCFQWISLTTHNFFEFNQIGFRFLKSGGSLNGGGTTNITTEETKCCCRTFRAFCCQICLHWNLLQARRITAAIILVICLSELLTSPSKLDPSNT